MNLAAEDELSESVLAKAPRSCITSWNRAALFVPWAVLTDLDRGTCPAALIDEWLTKPKHPNLLLRVAAREVEAWLLADRSTFAQCLRVAEKWVPVDPDGLPAPKGRF